jgi:hypothetical protein
MVNRLMQRHRMPRNASFSLYKPQITHATEQLIVKGEVCPCSGSAKRFRPKCWMRGSTQGEKRADTNPRDPN